MEVWGVKSVAKLAVKSFVKVCVTVWGVKSVAKLAVKSFVKVCGKVWESKVFYKVGGKENSCETTSPSAQLPKAKTMRPTFCKELRGGIS